MTPTTDKILSTFTLKTQEGLELNKVAVDGQKEIAETILTRQSPDGKNKIHVMAHTRYGKSIIVGAAVAIRAAVKKEKWAIVAPSKEQAQIIMDYVLFFSVNDPIISQLLKTDAKILKEERLTQRRARDHITYLNGGEVRTFSMKQTMGFGAANLVLDEAGLVEDEYEAKAFRMLGDNPQDFFVIKIGNPFLNNHFKQAYLDDSYYHINIDARRGVKEGRLSKEILDEQKKKPHYHTLYENVFPDEEAKDKYGYLPLITHSLLERAQVDPDQVEHLGSQRIGADPADGGENISAAVKRSNSLAEIKLTSHDLGVLDFTDEVARMRDGVDQIYYDKQGVGAGGVRRLEAARETKRLLVPTNAGEPVDQEALPESEDAKDYANLRAYMYWKLRLWLEGGGKLAKDDRWKNLLAVRYKTNSKGKLEIIPKDLLAKPYYNVHDLGEADALSFTFNPNKPTLEYNTPDVQGGIEPFYPDIGV